MRLLPKMPASGQFLKMDCKFDSAHSGSHGKEGNTSIFRSLNALEIKQEIGCLGEWRVFF